METAAGRLRLALEMHDIGVRMYRQRMRREHPDEADKAIDGRVQRWLSNRPGAESGDGIGRRSSRLG